MSDCAEQYFQAWSSVMVERGVVQPRKLLCACHVIEAFKRQLVKILNIEKRISVFKDLMVVMKELDINKFNRMYETFMTGLNLDSLTKSYHTYLEENYGNNKEEWAYCHRRGLRINTNMSLEAMHRIVKHNYFKGNVVKRLDEAIHHVLEFLEDRRQDWILTMKKGKITKKDTHTFKYHKTAVVNQNNYLVQFLSSNTFKVNNINQRDKLQSHDWKRVRRH